MNVAVQGEFSSQNVASAAALPYEQNLIVSHKPLVCCALILLSLFQQIIGRRGARAVHRFQADSMKTSF